jgi:hypothetical protein
MHRPSERRVALYGVAAMMIALHASDEPNLDSAKKKVMSSAWSRSNPNTRIEDVVHHLHLASGARRSAEEGSRTIYCVLP